MKFKNDVFGVFSVFIYGVRLFSGTQLIHQNTPRIHCDVSDVFLNYGIQANRHQIHQIHCFFIHFEL